MEIYIYIYVSSTVQLCCSSSAAKDTGPEQSSSITAYGNDAQTWNDRTTTFTPSLHYFHISKNNKPRQREEGSCYLWAQVLEGYKTSLGPYLAPWLTRLVPLTLIK